MTSVPHPLFHKNLLDLKLGWLTGLANRFLSTGAACYYVQDSGVRTRVHLYNYFGLLNGRPFKARWILRAYATDGKSYKEISGAFEGMETAVVELGSVAPSSLGLCMVFINPVDSGRTIKKTFSSLYYVEYYTAASSGYIHSLGYPVPKLYNAHDYIVTSIHPEGDPQLVLSNSCHRLLSNYPKVLAQEGPRIEIENHRKEIRKASLPPVAPLACRRVRMLDLWPDFIKFTDGQPVLMQLRGPNILYSPLLMQQGSNGFLSVEHFQGLDWEDLQ